MGPTYLGVGHKLIGAVQFKQIRIKSDSCSIPKQLGDSVTTCYARNINEETESKVNYGPGTEYFTYQSGNESFNGQFGNHYPGIYTSKENQKKNRKSSFFLNKKENKKENKKK